MCQCTPEAVTRPMEVRTRKQGAAARETGRAEEPPVERISINAVFSAADDLNDKKFIALQFGVGPQLAALEKMVYPAGKISGLIGAALDAIGDALFGGG